MEIRTLHFFYTLCVRMLLCETTFGLRHPEKIKAIGPITCIRQDRFTPGRLLLCSNYTSILSYNLETHSITTIVGGNNVAGGYYDGLNEQARFEHITDLHQLNKSAILVSDHGNDCIRLIYKGNTTAFAGACPKAVIDGRRVLFRKPYGILYIPRFNSLLITDNYSSGIRILNLDNNTIKRACMSREQSWAYQSDSRYLIYNEHTNEVFLSTSTSVFKTNPDGADLQLVHGRKYVSMAGADDYISMQHEFDETLKSPQGLAFFQDGLIMVAETDRDQIRFVPGTIAFAISVKHPLSIYIDNDFIYIGGMDGLYRISLSVVKEDFQIAARAHKAFQASFLLIIIGLLPLTLWYFKQMKQI